MKQGRRKGTGVAGFRSREVLRIDGFTETESGAGERRVGVIFSGYGVSV